MINGSVVSLVSNARILFLENRSITDIWSGVADLVQPDFDCKLLRFNRAFGCDFPGAIFDLVESQQSEAVYDPHVEAFIRTLCQTDRAVYLHGATEPDIRKAVSAVLATLDQIEFDLVIGEVTSVYERVVEFHCRNYGIPFLVPMTARIPPDHFIFLNGASLFPLPIAIRPHEKTHLGNAVDNARRHAGKNDLAMTMVRNVRMHNSIRTLSGWLRGERLHTPSPWRKVALIWRRILARSWLDKIPSAGIEEVNSSAVIYCMHVQPESTLDTYSPDFWNQAEVIRLIADACKSVQRPFLVRPHPRWRHEVTLHLVKAVASGVRILSPQVGMKNLLRCRPTIVTVSGTVLLEAAVAGVPTIALDRSYLASFPGIVQVPLADLGKVLSGEIVMTPASPEAQREWFEAAGQFTHRGLISPPEWCSEALSHKNLSDIATGVRLAAHWCNQHPRELPA